MSVERWWSRARARLDAATEPVANPCPICVHLNAWYGDRIAEATHSAGGPDWEWRACYDHFKVLSAAQFIGLLRPPTETKQAPGRRSMSEPAVEQHLRVARSFISSQEPPNTRMAIERLIEAVAVLAAVGATEEAK